MTDDRSYCLVPDCTEQPRPGDELCETHERADNFLIGKPVVFNGRRGVIAKYDGNSAKVKAVWAEPPSDL